MRRPICRLLALSGLSAWVLLMGPAAPADPGAAPAHTADANTTSVGPVPQLSKLFGGPFSLTDHNRQVRTDRDFRGKYLLIFFGYTYCPDICPLDMSIIAQSMDILGDAATGVQPLFITVDPKRDRPALLKEFVETFDPRILALTGTEQQIRAVSKSFRVHRSKVITDKLAPEDYLVNHSSLTFLMGPMGEFITLFPHNTAPEKIARVVKEKLVGKNIRDQVRLQLTPMGNHGIVRR